MMKARMSIRAFLLEDSRFEGGITLRWSQKAERCNVSQVNAAGSFLLSCQSDLNEECSIGDVGSLPAKSV